MYLIYFLYTLRRIQAKMDLNCAEYKTKYYSNEEKFDTFDNDTQDNGRNMLTIHRSKS